ncbi:MAG TPA: hypothetical protein VF329_09050 [Gammaproteobacteria bacterium]
MRATDHRYRGEKAKFELALRMIGHEARTGTIRYWTGLSDDRIRKLYTSYFKYGDAPVRRRRGRSPTQVAPLVKTPLRALESGVFTNLLLANGLLSTDPGTMPKLKGNIDLGHRFCECYETYCALVPRANLSFEWGWNLLISIRRGDELGIARCDVCSVGYVFDLLALPPSTCPSCATLAHQMGRGALEHEALA